jgi:hypothetical protein
MLVGAGVYAALYPLLKVSVLAWADYGKIGLNDVLGVSPWLIVAFFWAGSIALFSWLEKKGV